MAETSGFFQAMWDDSLMNPTTQEYTGWWDRNYLAKEFMEYFALFVGNGVFASPTNQLMVLPGTGRTVIVSPGWAFINGGWYHNDAELVLSIAANSSSTNRVDSVRVRYSAADRKITSMVLNDETGVIRGDTIYDLELAEIVVTPGLTTVPASSITDMRPNGDVCGFVTGLLEVVSAKDLFSQFQGMFDEWFNTVKDQVTGDLAIRLQQEFEDLNQAVIDYQANVESDISEFKTAVNQANTQFKQTVTEQVSTINQTAQNAYNTMKGFTDADFTLGLQTLTFVEKQCIIEDERITADSLIDVYFTADSMAVAESAQIYVDSETGRIILTATMQPSSPLDARIRVRVM